jgi:outer membrane protein with beta-barrel domain
MHLRTIATMIAVLAGFTAATAGADTVLVGYAGATAGGDLEDNKTTYGAALDFMGDRGFGFEIDFGYTPEFYGDAALFGSDNNVATLMGNVLLTIPLGDTAKLYGAAGGGLLRSRVDDVDDFFDVTRNDLGVNLGGGLLLNLGDKVGARGDVRYFRNLVSDEDTGDFPVDLGGFHFWRVTAGLAYRF